MNVSLIRDPSPLTSSFNTVAMTSRESYNARPRLKEHFFPRSVDIMAQLGGEGLSPFYCLIEGGKNGWLMNEMEDLFRYAQILRRGEYTTAVEVASDTVGVEQIPNLMRAVGYFPTNKEVVLCVAQCPKSL